MPEDRLPSAPILALTSNSGCIISKLCFEYIDIQKIRTPKGLDWLRAQYPSLTQNELMREMQGIRMMHSTIWAGGIREIVSAENSDVKFVVSDHPITIYNHAAPPEARIWPRPNSRVTRGHLEARRGFGSGLHVSKAL